MTLLVIIYLGPTAPVCMAEDYDRSEWGDYPNAEVGAAPTWTTAADDVPAPGITMDHHVALLEAHVAGGCGWTESRKTEFAGDADNLNPTTRSFNASKGSRTPERLIGIAASIIDTDGEKCAYAVIVHIVAQSPAGPPLALTGWMSAVSCLRIGRAFRRIATDLDLGSDS